jgi:hypothetical protein
VIRRLRALISTPSVTAALGFAVVGIGLKMLTDLVDELRTTAAALETEVQELAARRDIEVAAMVDAYNQRVQEQLRTDIAAGRAYPAAGDLDPLHRGGLVDDGDPQPEAEPELSELAR